MWKALNRSLSVDARIQEVEIPVVSRCNYCLVSHDENLDHVLSTRDFASGVWISSGGNGKADRRGYILW